MSEKNRFAETKKFLEEVQDEIGSDCTVSSSYGPDGFSFMVSFHKNEDLDEDEIIQVEFDESDFQESKVYEESLRKQIKEYAEEYIKNKS